MGQTNTWTSALDPMAIYVHCTLRCSSGHSSKTYRNLHTLYTQVFLRVQFLAQCKSTCTVPSGVPQGSVVVPMKIYIHCALMCSSGFRSWPYENLHTLYTQVFLNVHFFYPLKSTYTVHSGISQGSVPGPIEIYIHCSLRCSTVFSSWPY